MHSSGSDAASSRVRFVSAGADSDSDGTLDCQETCPSDPLKTAPGICGCGISETDSDSDGNSDCQDSCVSDPLKTAPGLCGCGVSDSDLNTNSIPDCFKGQELKARLVILRSAVGRLKRPGKTRKSKAAAKQRVAAVQGTLAQVLNFASANASEIESANAADIPVLIKNIETYPEFTTTFSQGNLPVEN